MLFPEGTRSTSGEVREFKATLGYLAMTHRVPILPMWLEGTYESLPKGAALPRKRDLEVRIGPPLTYDDLRAGTDGIPRSEAYRAASRLVQEAVEALRDGRRDGVDRPVVRTIMPSATASASANGDVARTRPVSAKKKGKLKEARVQGRANGKGQRANANERRANGNARGPNGRASMGTTNGRAARTKGREARATLVASPKKRRPRAATPRSGG